MRYDKQVTFVKEGSEVYNPNTGDYIASEPTMVDKWSDVTDVGEDRLIMLYGSIKQKAKVIRLNSVYKEPFDYVLIDTVKYIVTSNKHFRHESVFYVGEGQ